MPDMHEALPPDDFDMLCWAVERHVARFGTAPPTHAFQGSVDSLTRQILAAVARGRPLTPEEACQRFDLAAPPRDPDR